MNNPPIRTLGGNNDDTDLDGIEESYKEHIGAPIFETSTPKAVIVRQSYDRERPEGVTFAELLYYHKRVPQINMAITMYKELITGTEMSLHSKNTEAIKFLQDWIRKTNFQSKFDSVVETNLICGNAILEKLSSTNITDVAEVDMSSIINKKRDKYGNLEYYEQRTETGTNSKLGEGNLKSFIEFNLTSYSREPWGDSLFQSLVLPRVIGKRRGMSILENLIVMEDAMAGIYNNMAFPRVAVTIPTANDDLLKSETRYWSNYQPGDIRVGTTKPDIEFFEMKGSQSRFTDIITHYEKLVEIGTQFPHDIMTGDFSSRASSSTTENLVMKKVRGYQRYLANKLKVELFDSILIQNDFDPEEVDLEVSFTSQNIVELDVTQVHNLTTDGIMTKNEARQWLRENTGIELPDDKEILAKNDMAATIAKNAQDIKTEALKKMVREVSVKPKKMCDMCKESQHVYCTKKGCTCQ